MRLRIDGHLIEGDENDLKKLLFGSQTPLPAEKDDKEKAEPLHFKEETPEQPVHWAKKKLGRPAKRGKYHISAETARKRREFLIEFNAKAKALAKSEGISFRDAMIRLGKKGQKLGKFCGICNKPVPRYKQRYCSSECAKKAQLASIKKWQKNHKEQHNHYRNIARAKKKGTEGKVPSYLKKDKSEQRRVWIQSRAKSLDKQFQLGYERSLEQARAEWDYKLKKKTPDKTKGFTLDEFPKFDRISGNSLVVLESMFRHMIGTQGKLNYYATTASITLDNQANWSGYIWHDFVAETLLKSQKIIDYFNAKGKIERFVDTKGHEYLQYIK